MRIGYWRGYGDVEHFRPDRIDPGDGEILITRTVNRWDGGPKQEILMAEGTYWCDDTLIFYLSENY